jgi:glycosyltransferase involved in cell wall biosynthesis
MFLNRIYYSFKPVLPWRLRLALRRLRAKRRRREFANVWPIEPEGGQSPYGWPGWPEGKRFALVLTHDVEGVKGVSRVKQLMNLEQRHGFQSSFNFVPEGGYRVDDALRETLLQCGFEVGIHGLRHDGKLYRSKEEFRSRALRINEYLEKWKACGFRSPLMQHKLHWLHALRVTYDSSTFDTDPFEPEPDGVSTIFPFWVPGPSGNGSGYVELPYTLAQDFTLFKVLGERDIDIWKTKLDWIVEHRGMVLLNTHPDYMCFGGLPARDEFPVSYYEELLSYVREKYEGSYWSALPRVVAQYYRETVPLSCRNTRKKICMLAYTHYEFDNRVRRYAETLAKRGDKVDVIALGSTGFGEPIEAIKGVTVHRIQPRKHDERNKWTYAWRLLKFLWRSSRSLTNLHARYSYDLIHIHNMPDFLVFAAWYPKLTGARLILDIHDLVPELFASKFVVPQGGIYGNLLMQVEKASARFVDHVIVSNDLWRERLLSRSVSEAKCSVFLNHVDPTVFYQHQRKRHDDKIVMIFPGSFQWHQGLDLAIEALAHLKTKVSNAELHLYGGSGGNLGDELRRLAQQLGVDADVKFCGSVAFDQVAQVIANADIGIVPKRADSFGNEAYSTKIMEFMSQGIPVVASSTKIDRFYFDERVVRFFPSGNSRAMAEAVLELINNKELCQQLVARGHEYVDRNGWQNKKQDYLDLVDCLVTEVDADGASAKIPITNPLNNVTE